MFFWSVLVAWSLMHAYLAWRLAGAWPLRGRVRRRWVWLAAVGLGLSLPLSRLLGRPAPLEAFGVHWLGVMIPLTTCLLGLELLSGLGLLVAPGRVRGALPKLRAGALAAGLLLAGLALVQGLRAPEVSEHEVRLADLPPAADGLRLVALGDLHLGGPLGADWLAARVAEVQALGPDAVLFLGDVVEGHGDRALEELLRPLAGLTPRLGAYAVLGNHDAHGNPARVVAALEGVGVRVLRDEWLEPLPGLILAGLDDSGRLSQDVSDERLAACLAGRPREAVTVLLSHRPQAVERAAASGVGLMLAAHTHGGQIWPVGFLTALSYPHLEGRFEVDGMLLLVTRGVGTWGPRMRLWCPGEILGITLRRARAQGYQRSSAVPG